MDDNDSAVDGVGTIDGVGWWDVAVDQALRLTVLLAVRGWDLAGQVRGAYVAAGRGLLDRFVRNPVVNRAVDAQLERLLPTVVDRALDEALDVLAADPDRLRELIRDQRATIVDELVDRLRDGAAVGDGATDRLRDRLLHR